MLMKPHMSGRLMQRRAGVVVVFFFFFLLRVRGEEFEPERYYKIFGGLW